MFPLFCWCCWPAENLASPPPLTWAIKAFSPTWRSLKSKPCQRISTNFDPNQKQIPGGGNKINILKFDLPITDKANNSKVLFLLIQSDFPTRREEHQNHGPQTLFHIPDEPWRVRATSASNTETGESDASTRLRTTRVNETSPRSMPQSLDSSGSTRRASTSVTWAMTRNNRSPLRQADPAPAKPGSPKSSVSPSDMLEGTVLAPDFCLISYPGTFANTSQAAAGMLARKH